MVSNDLKPTTDTELLPFLKWAGGKRWLTRHFAAQSIPFSGRYIEPFVGSAALFFSLNPRAALLSDANEELIDTYRAIRDNWRSVQKQISMHQNRHCSDHYYAVRNKNPRTMSGRAARFIYLNRTCWNGLYRVNQNGEFNVPIGTKTNVVLQTDDFRLVAERLQKAKLIAGDFEAVVDKAKDGDLVFADPPYTVRHNLNGFVKYNEKLFSWDDQIRLRDALVRASNRGAKVFVTNADHHSVHKIYQANFYIQTAERFSAISSLSESRGKYSELIITNWRP